MSKKYLGDGAYVDDGAYLGEVVLTTSDGIRDTNTVVLGPDEVMLLFKFIEDIRKRMREAAGIGQ